MSKNYFNSLPPVRLKYLFTERITGAWGEDADADHSTVCIRAADFRTEKLSHKTDELTRRSFDDAEVNRKSLRKGDLILENSGGGENQPVGRIVKFELSEPALCSNFLKVLRPNPQELNSSFGAYLMFSLWVNRAVIPYIKQTTGIQNLDEEAYLGHKVCIPPLEQQQTIADFLDRETARLDALVAAKERWLELLAEKRRALITRTVTRGLNPTVPLHDSGIEWLGKIPTHWKIERSKWLFKERDERTENDDGEMLTVSHITGVTRRSEKDVNMFEAETTEGYKICCKGDLAINTLWAWMGAMGVSPCDGIVSPAYNVYALGPEMDGGYVEALVRMPLFAQEIIRYSKGIWSSRLRLYPEGFFEARLPVPPLDEQRAIVAHISAETVKIDALSAATERTIDLLKERRAALIAAAVTGKIAV